MTSIGRGTFHNCSNLTTIYSFNLVPPTCDNPFNDALYHKATLYVPQESLGVYRTARCWNGFLNIQGVDAAGINDINANESDGQNMYYDINGRRSATPHLGVNIVRYSDGSARKVFIK